MFVTVGGGDTDGVDDGGNGPSGDVFAVGGCGGDRRRNGGCVFTVLMLVTVGGGGVTDGPGGGGSFVADVGVCGGILSRSLSLLSRPPPPNHSLSFPLPPLPPPIICPVPVL